MRLLKLVRHPENRLDVVAGLIDGIMTALVLASGQLFEASNHASTWNLAWRVGLAAAATTGFVFFVAHYAQLRLELVRIERELNLLDHGRMSASALGRSVFREAAIKAALAALFSFVGASLPLLLCAAVPEPAWLGASITIALLGLLGWLLATTFYGLPWVWMTGLVAGGIALTYIGVQLRIAG